MLINLSNHPYKYWSDEQKEAALPYGDVVDLDFPVIDSCGGEEYIHQLANSYLGKIIQLTEGVPCSVHVMGEMTFLYSIVSNLQRLGYHCIASTSERDVTYTESNDKVVGFHFIRFRSYQI